MDAPLKPRSREPADEPSLESRVFHDERARHNDRGAAKGAGAKGQRGEGGGAPEGLRPVTRCNSLAKSHFGKTFVRSGRLKNCASRRGECEVNEISRDKRTRVVILRRERTHLRNSRHEAETGERGFSAVKATRNVTRLRECSSRRRDLVDLLRQASRA